MKPQSTDVGARLLVAGDTGAANSGRANYTLSGAGSADVGTATGTGAIAATPSITLQANGWYRCSLSVTLVAPANICVFIYPGTATSQTTASQTLVWGAQLEAGAFPTSYIATTGTSATRSADIATITGTAFSGWYNQGQGTMFADVTVLSTADFQQVISINDGSSSNRAELRVVGGAGTQIRSDCVVGGSSKYANNFIAVADQSRRVAALALQSNNFRLQSGSSWSSPSSDAVPSVDRLYLNYATFGAGEINGTIARLAYWPVRLGNSVLQGITQ
jgi:hypothetical protein